MSRQASRVSLPAKHDATRAIRSAASGQYDALARLAAVTCSYANKVTIYNCRN
jgi:hypothetical protein